MVTVSVVCVVVWALDDRDAAVVCLPTRTAADASEQRLLRRLVEDYSAAVMPDRCLLRMDFQVAPMARMRDADPTPTPSPAQDEPASEGQGVSGHGRQLLHSWKLFGAMAPTSTNSKLAPILSVMLGHGACVSNDVATVGDAVVCVPARVLFLPSASFCVSMPHL